MTTDEDLVEMDAVIGALRSEKRALEAEKRALKAKLRENRAIEEEAGELRKRCEEAEKNLAILGGRQAAAQLRESRAERDDLRSKLLLAEQRIGLMEGEVEKVGTHNAELNRHLQQEITKKIVAEREAERHKAASAHFRIAHLVANNPAAGEGGTEYRLRLRLLAFTGDPVARELLDLDENVCPMCGASPACVVGDTPRIHGPHVTRTQRKYLQALVEEAINREVSPARALRSWAETGAPLAIGMNDDSDCTDLVPEKKKGGWLFGRSS